MVEVPSEVVELVCGMDASGHGKDLVEFFEGESFRLPRSLQRVFQNSLREHLTARKV